MKQKTSQILLYTAERTMGLLSGASAGALVAVGVTNPASEIDMIQFGGLTLMVIVLSIVSIIAGIKRGAHK
jgi:type IV secretory pathway TrbD component